LHQERVGEEIDFDDEDKSETVVKSPRKTPKANEESTSSSAKNSASLSKNRCPPPCESETSYDE